MALFGKSGASAARGGSRVADQLSLVGRDTTLEGTLRAEGDVRIGGRVAGTVVTSGRVIIGESGVIDGEVHARTADVAGRVQGDVHVEGRLGLKRTARVEGTVHAGQLVVEEGAHLSGDCEMGGAAGVLDGALSAHAVSSSAAASGDGAEPFAALDDLADEDRTAKKRTVEKHTVEKHTVGS